MTNRERIVNTLTGRETDRLPFYVPLGPWWETIVRWEKEGMQGSWHDNFNFDNGIVEVDINYGYSPAFERKIIGETENTQIITDEYGITLELMKTHATIPKYLDYPLKNAADWKELKKRLDPEDPARFPDNWEELIKRYNEGDAVVQLGRFPYGLFGTLRDMMGVEELMYAFYDEPDMVRDMMGYLTDMWLALYEKVCRDVKVDIIHMWEDMSGKQGSLISIDMVREFMLPNYRRLRDFADSHNIPVVSVDTDGDCSELIPPMMDAGINYFWPFEVAAGSDVVEFARLYPNLGIMGGIDKREVAKGKEAIDREFERIAPLRRNSRYIPAIDHLVHPDISWDDFNYFAKKLNEYTHW